MMESKFAVWWLKRDLRIHDNLALSQAIRFAEQFDCPLIALWISEPEAFSASEYHSRREKFVLQCLEELEPQLRLLKVQLLIAEGMAEDVFSVLVACGLKRVFSHQETGVLWTFRRDLLVKQKLASAGVTWEEFPTNGVVRGLRDRNRWQQLYQLRMSASLLVLPAVPNLQCPDQDLFSQSIFEGPVRMLNWQQRAGSKMSEAAMKAPRSQQKGGESIAHGLLRRFLSPEIHPKYLYALAKPYDAQYFSSRLSPYLAFGCLSSRQVLAALNSSGIPSSSKSLSAFKSRLAWRCHFIQKLENFPEMEVLEQNIALKNLRPEMSREEFERWENGQTGFPLVDACLRSVHQTGFLNFRMRAMLMSFATHLLWRDWRMPAWDLARAFLDFEAGIHFSQVHMQAAVTGNNQIRIYNPLKQSLENDADARFIKQWVPELRNIPAARIHSAEDLPAAYPSAMCDLKNAMGEAREKLFACFKKPDVRSEARKVQENLGSRGGPLSWRGRTRKKKVSPKSLFDPD